MRTVIQSTNSDAKVSKREWGAGAQDPSRAAYDCTTIEI